MRCTGLFLVAPDNRESEVRAQLARPAFRKISDLHVRWLPYGKVERHREAMARFGNGLKAVDAIARTLGVSSSFVRTCDWTRDVKGHTPFGRDDCLIPA